MNDWSTDWTMKKDGNVFSYTATIEAGTYQYKYIVDGTWMTDPFNPNTADDGGGNTNSTFTVTATGDTKPEDTRPEDTKPSNPLIPENPTVEKSPVVNGNEVTFYFESETATNIVISGSMNNWSTDWTMTKDGNVFSYTATIDAGTYQYKYIVDGEWMTDPFNPNTADDGSGNTNSTFEVTATISEPETTPDSEATTEGNSTEENATDNTTTEDDSKNEPTSDDTQDTQASDAVTDGAKPNGLPTGVIIAIAAVVTVVVVVGGFAGFTYFKKKKAE